MVEVEVEVPGGRSCSKTGVELAPSFTGMSCLLVELAVRCRLSRVARFKVFPGLAVTVERFGTLHIGRSLSNVVG